MSINKDSQKAPILRFKGFTDDWEQRKVDEIADKTFGGGTPKTSVEEYWNGDFPWVQSSDFELGKLFDIEPSKFITKDAIAHSATKIVPENSIAIVTRVGVGKLALMPYDYATSQDFLSLSNLNINPVFGVYALFLLLEKEIKNIQGTSIKGITKSDLLEKVLTVTSDIQEQSKIGKFFKTLDDTITLHQRKLDQLNQLKEALLQQMFPGKGETVPKLRFAGFEGEWEERKLGELGETKSGIGFPDDEQGGKKGIPFFKVSDMNNIGNEHELKNSNNYVDTEQLKRRNWKPIMNVPAVIFAKVGAAIMLNRKRIVRMPFLLDNNTMAYIFDDSWNSDFGKILFETIYLPRYAQVGALPSYNGSDINSIKVFIPNKKEQEKIGVFFKQLDNTITLQQRKLNQLQNMKQVLLQNMFI